MNEIREHASGQTMRSLSAAEIVQERRARASFARATEIEARRALRIARWQLVRICAALVWDLALAASVIYLLLRVA